MPTPVIIVTGGLTLFRISSSPPLPVIPLFSQLSKRQDQSEDPYSRIRRGAYGMHLLPYPLFFLGVLCLNPFQSLGFCPQSQLMNTYGDLCENTIVGVLVISTFIARIWRDMESKLKICFCCHGNDENSGS